MNSTQREGSREFISVSMPWRSEGGDDNSKVRRHTSLYRVSDLRVTFIRNASSLGSFHYLVPVLSIVVVIVFHVPKQTSINY